MPIMLKHNEATELGITNGQEGCVVGWTLTADSENREYLETLFVKLTQPAKNISLHGLLLNVVPITRMTSTILVTFPNGNVRSVSHSQVQIILNFSMTDYNSQGRTRDRNVVNLSSSKNHQAIASSNGTVIMQALTPSAIKKVTQGIEGDLRLELHELELLDHITNMKYNRLLPSEIEGSTQNELLYNFRQYKGRNFVPDATKPLKLDKLVDYVPAVGSKHIRTVGDDGTVDNTRYKRARPVSFVWDHIHHSCPYDALFMIFADLCDYLHVLSQGLGQVTVQATTMESVRDNVHQLLFNKDPGIFHINAAGTYLDHSLTTEVIHCTGCGDQPRQGALKYHHAVIQCCGGSTAHAMKYYQTQLCKRCSRCCQSSSVTETYNIAPKIVMMELASGGSNHFSASKTIKVLHGNNDTAVMALHGIVYFVNKNHFSAQVITKDNEVWYNDGMANNVQSVLEGKLSDTTVEDLSVCPGGRASLAVYTHLS
ncbi:hypothetical protein C8J56DRAFT_1004802 [Mycena floridula]|nr:hypothetical protein C8J56DRAFT_1004802 [Mycena floridula]